MIFSKKQMNNKPLISIIIPIFNGRKYLDSCLESIIMQNINDQIEVIIIDDYSTETYSDIINKYNKTLSITYILNSLSKHNPGAARQCGLNIANGEWIVFLDVDDILISNSYKPVLEYIKINKCYTVIHTGEIYNDASGLIKQTEHNWTWLHDKWYNKQFLDNFNIHFNFEYLYNEDTGFNLQCFSSIILNNLPIYYADIITYQYNYNPNSITNQDKIINGRRVGYIVYALEALFENTIVNIHDCLVQNGHNNNAHILLDVMADVFIKGYFYCQNHYFYYGYYGIDYAFFIKYKNIIEEDLETSLLDFLAENPHIYQQAYLSITQLELPFLPYETITDFLQKIEG